MSDMAHMLSAGLGTSVALARPLWRKAVAEDLVDGKPERIATEALDAAGFEPLPRERAATLPGPISLDDLERIERHVESVWGDALVDLQAKQEAKYLGECEEAIRTASLERWTPQQFKARIQEISEVYGVRGWGAKAATWYRTVVLNAPYNRGLLMAYAGTSAKRLYPYLGLITRQDERVRASHRLLHGFAARLEWEGWNLYTPPLDWGCRCKLVPISWDVARGSKYKGDFPRGRKFLQARRTLDDDGEMRRVSPGSPEGFRQPLQVFNSVLPFTRS